MGLARDQRLCDPRVFKQLFSKKPCLKGSAYWLRVLPNQLEHGRLGVLVAKKKFPRAVDRHCLKRLCREAFRHSPAFFSSQDYLLSLKPLSLQPGQRQLLLKELGEAFRVAAGAGFET